MQYTADCGENGWRHRGNVVAPLKVRDDEDSGEVETEGNQNNDLVV